MKIDEIHRLLERYQQTNDPSPILRLLRKHNILSDDILSDDFEEQPTVLANATVQRKKGQVVRTRADDVIDVSNDTLSFTTISVSEETSEGTQAAQEGSVTADNVGQKKEEVALGRYEKMALLGKGGMGAVWQVRDSQLHRTLAMKVIHGGGTDLRSREELLEEAQISAQLQHPGIIPVHEIGQLPDGELYFTMKQIHGRTFKKIMSTVHQSSLAGVWRPASDGWNFRRLISVFHSVCETIAYAHSRGVVHLDIKPSNVMVGDYGEVSVVDWGISKVLPARHLQGSDEDRVRTERSAAQKMDDGISGTPTYMSPEQAIGRAKDIDQRSDIYALGAMLYQILTGVPPYRGTAQMILADKRLMDPPSIKQVLSPPERLNRSPLDPPPKARSVPEELITVCERAMQRNKNDRYQTASEMSSVVQDWLEGASRRDKALEILDKTHQIEQDIVDVRLFAQELWDKANRLLQEVSADNTSVWNLWNKAHNQREKAKRYEQEVEQLLQGALIYAPEMTDIYHSLIDFEYRELIAAAMRSDTVYVERSRRKINTYLDMISLEEKQRWEQKLQLELDSVNMMRQRRGYFVGRTTDMQRTLGLFQEHRLINILGTAGVGKTYFTIELANRWRETYKAPVVFCDATLATDALSLETILAQALGIRLHPQDSVQQLLSELKRREEFLLIIDNVEQVSKEVAVLLQSWLPSAPELTIVVTSRVPLGISEEQQYRLETLSLLEAAELFVLRARRQLPTLQLDESSQRVVCSIVQRLDRLPLAIELAAARTSTLSLVEIEKRLQKSFALLRGRLRNPKHQALQGALDWSWDLLSVWGKSALAQCGSFRNGFTLEAAEAIVDLSVWSEAPSTLDVIEALCDDNLLFKVQQEDGGFRYMMLASIQEYAVGKLHSFQSMIDGQVSYRHAQYFAHRWRRAKESLMTERSNGTLAFISELDNFIVGAEKGLVKEAKDCCLAALDILKMQGPISLGIELTENFLRRPNLRDEIRLPIHLERANCLRISGRVKEARKEARIAMELAERLDESSDESD